MLPFCLERVRVLNEAIKDLNYAKVEELLADVQVPVNVPVAFYGNFSEAELPLTKMLSCPDSEMARLFINWPRIDWISPKSDRSMLQLHEEHGIQFEVCSDILFHRKENDSREFKYFYYIDCEFVQACPQEAEQIYEKIIEEVVKAADSDNYDQLLFATCNSLIPFKIALKYTSNIAARDNFGQGDTLLHFTSNLEVAKLLIEMGADINAVNENNDTPLAKHAKYCNWHMVKLFINFGADIGEASLDLEFFDHFEVTEDIFTKVLSVGYDCISLYNLECLFEEYPHYKKMFESNLPRHLCSLNDCILSDYANSLNDEDYLMFLKNLIIRSAGRDCLWTISERTAIIKQRANELLQLAIKSNSLSWVQDLVLFGADYNLFIDGKPPLFVSGRTEVIEALLKNGSDPFIECNGFKFFERDDFYVDQKKISAGWLIELVKKGFDIFTPAGKTGKSLIDHLNPKAELVFDADTKFSVPVSKISQTLFNVVMNEPLDACVSIDEDDNTIFDYVLQLSCDLSNISNLLGKKDIYDLVEIKNKFGKSLLERIIEHNENLTLAYFLINTDQDFQLYAETFLKVHGVSFFKMFGGQLLIYALFNKPSPSWLLAEYFIESGVSINRIISGECLGHRILDQIVRRYKDDIVDEGLIVPNYLSIENSNQIFDFTLKHGYVLDSSDIIVVIKLNRANLVAEIVEACEQIGRCIMIIAERIHCEKLRLNDAFRAFFSHPKVLAAVPWEGSCTFLELYFFILCGKGHLDDTEHLERTKFFLEIGVDARRMTGLRVFAKISESALFRGFGLLRDAGWTLLDFKNIMYRTRYSVYEFFKSKNFSEFLKEFPPEAYQLPTIQFDQLSLDKVAGDREICAICKEEFQPKDKIINLECKHMFHAGCSRDFLLEQSTCPYCRSPLSSPKLE